MTKTAVLCQLALMLQLLLLLAPDAASGQSSLTIFWYIDVNDLIGGKTPDLHITRGGGPYGTKDPEIDVNEKTHAGDAADVVRGSGHPSGSNINKVVWDPKLEDAAEKSARRCDGGSAGDGSVGSADEIVVASTARLSYTDALMLVKVQGAAEYDLGSNRCKRANYPPCDQYRLLMTAGLTGFACARAHCPDTALPYRVHCVVSPKPTGSAALDKPYQPGSPCQLCPRERGYCYNNLCVSHEDKVKILRDKPGSTVTCDAPCMNCGERKDEANTCSCHCPAGYTTAVDCSAAGPGADPKVLSCGACARAGTPCLNGGIDSGEAAGCRCLCPKEFKGKSCGIPDSGYIGGALVPFQGPEVCAGAANCGRIPTDIGKVPNIVADLKPKLADEINKFCKKSQENYIKCCGVGTLPTSGPMDFVSEADVQHLQQQVSYDAQGRLIVPIYVTVRGNNGLCRKNTADPPPIVPVPPGVLDEVLKDNLPVLKAPCCQDSVTAPLPGSVKDKVDATDKLSMDISCMVVTI